MFDYCVVYIGDGMIFYYQIDCFSCCVYYGGMYQKYMMYYLCYRDLFKGDEMCLSQFMCSLVVLWLNILVVIGI